MSKTVNVMVERVGDLLVAFSYATGATSRQRDVEVIHPIGGGARYARTIPMGGRYGAFSADVDDFDRFAAYHAAIDAELLVLGF